MKKRIVMLCAASIMMLSICGCAELDLSEYAATEESTIETETEEDTEPVETTETEETSGTNISSPMTYDESIFGLPVKVAGTTVFTVVSVYGYSEDDFALMEDIIIDFAHTYGVAEDDETIRALIQESIGEEGGNGHAWDDAGIITSAPNEYENEYRIDLYIYEQD